MCRFLVYKGSDEILLSKLILDPTHSILNQSFDSRLRLDMRRPHNGDGFGIGYYTDPKLGPEPCIFTSTTPAWNCVNLQRIASKTASHLIFAHVRATTEGSLSDDNCHPFCHGSLMWMHNGGLGGWKHIKRKLGKRLADKWYLGVQGGTDSEWAFALYLDTLERMGHNPSSPPATGFGPTVLRHAMLITIQQINEFIAEIPVEVVQQENVDTRSLLNFAITDGHSVICTRYVSSRTDEAASLYYSSGTTWEDKSTKGEYQMDRRDKGADIVLVASEPLTFERESWVTVPTNSTLTIHKQTVMVHPILDEYYNFDPSQSRSTKFVQDKGLVTNEKVTTRESPKESPKESPIGSVIGSEIESHATSPTKALSLSNSDRDSIASSYQPQTRHLLSNSDCDSLASSFQPPRGRALSSSDRDSLASSYQPPTSHDHDSLASSYQPTSHDRDSLASSFQPPARHDSLSSTLTLLLRSIPTQSPTPAQSLMSAEGPEILCTSPTRFLSLNGTAPGAMVPLATRQMRSSLVDTRESTREITRETTREIARETPKVSELGNIKKKHSSVSASPAAIGSPKNNSAPKSSFGGDPMKIAQYFPELNLPHKLKQF